MCNSDFYSDRGGLLRGLWKSLPTGEGHWDTVSIQRGRIDRQNRRILFRESVYVSSPNKKDYSTALHYLFRYRESRAIQILGKCLRKQNREKFSRSEFPSRRFPDRQAREFSPHRSR